MHAAVVAFTAVIAAQTAPAPIDARQVEIAPGRSLNVVCMGTGPRTVLFESGGSDGADIWALVQPALADRVRACAYDRAGLGASDPGPMPRTPFAIVEDLHLLISNLGGGPVILVGHSLGGFNAKLHAALYPADVVGLVLIDPAEDRWWPRTRRWAVETFGASVAARGELGDQRFLAGLVQRYEGCAEAARTADLDPDSLTYRRCTDPVRLQLGPAAAEARRAYQVRAAYQSAQASEIASSVYGDARSDAAYEALFQPGAFGTLPMIVLTHEDPPSDDPVDRLGSEQGPRLHRETARLSSSGSHRSVSGSGHYIQLDRPDVVVAAVSDIVSAIGESARP